MKDFKQLIQDIHDSEINLSISRFRDDLWTVKVGDEMNGFTKEYNFSSLNELHEGLPELVITHYPNSTFAKKYKPLSE